MAPSLAPREKPETEKAPKTRQKFGHSDARTVGRPGVKSS
jgi:hypothetical protein